MQHIKLDLLVIVDVDRQLLTSALSEAGQGLASGFIADGLTGQAKRPLLLEGGTGLAMSPLGPLLLVSCNILPTSRAGRPRGHFYFGRFIGELVASLQLPVHSGRTSMPHSAPRVDALSANALRSVTILPLLNDEMQALTIGLEQARLFYQRTLASARYYFLLILVMALLAGLAVYLFLERVLVRRIVALRVESARFGRTHRPDDQYFAALAGRDEIGQLAHAFTDTAQRIVEQRTLLERERSIFERDSLTDPLTGLGDRRYLGQAMATDRKRRSDANRLVVAIDLDYFKQVNDRYGHDVGDQVLTQMAALLRRCCRGQDTLARSGGEGFSLACRDIDEAGALQVMERIRRETAEQCFGDPDQALQMSCSLGFSFCLMTSTDMIDSACDQKLLKLADLALYQAKGCGRNTRVGYRVARDGTCCALSNLDEPPSEFVERGELLKLQPSNALQGR